MKVDNAEKPLITGESRRRIVEAAQSLFMRDGYDNTSVNSIIEAVKLAKGTFYHYFSSKEGLLDAILDDFAVKIIEDIRTVMRDSTDAITKMNRMLNRGRQFKIEQKELVMMVTRAMYNPANLLLRHKLAEANIKHSLPVFREIIEQGEAEGAFKTAGAFETALIIMKLGEGISDVIAQYILKEEKTDEDGENIKRMSAAFNEAICRLLG
ncbi:MAG TPA: TetR/AcrR family transcriptional regulator, partial [bacterium]|nr:TetR/AcrR family transcriptional regulator [bacterium]